MAPTPAQLLLDQEAHFYEKRLLELKTLRNTHAAISQLPEEVLLAVFTEVQKDSRLTDWHQITHVCQRWRAVAIGAPILWTKPDTRKHDYTMLFLARSRAGTLNISSEFGISSNTLAAILGHIERVGSISIEHAETTCLQDIQTALLQSEHTACRLWKVDISGYWYRDKFTFSKRTIRHLARLRIFKLDKMDLDWGVLPLPQLHTLSLFAVMPTTPLSWRELLSTLSQMPLLQVLRFNVDSLGIHSSIADISVKAIEFSHLWDLHVDGCALDDIPYFVPRLVAPLLRHATVSCSGVGDSLNGADFIDLDYSSTTRALSALIKQGSFGVFNNACASITTSRFTIEHGIPKKSFSFSLPEYVDENYFIAEKGTLNPRIVRTLLHDINTFSKESIVKLVLNGHLAAEDLVDLFGNLPHLEEIEAWNLSAQEIIKSIGIPHDASYSVESVPFRHLWSLSLREEYDMLEIDLYDEEVWGDLRGVLMLRCEYGLPIHHLTVGCKAISAKRLKRLREIVANIDHPDGFEPEDAWQRNSESD